MAELAALSTQQPETSGEVPVSASTSAVPSPVPPAPVIKVWKPVAPGSAPKLPDFPESYYQPSASDLRAAHVGQTNKLKSLGVDTGFTTKAQRDKEARDKEAKRVSRYPKTVIRIRFADRHQIETTFPSSKTIQAVYDFAKSVLIDDVKEEAFVLYVPPRLELRPNDPKNAGKSLLDLQLAPSSILMIRFMDDALNDSTRVAPISPSLLETAEELPKPPSFDPTPEQLAAQATAAEAPPAEEKKGNTLGSGTKAPKWLQKMGKK